MSQLAAALVTVAHAAVQDVNGEFSPRLAAVVPEGFTKTCEEMGWNDTEMWARLSDGRRPWFEAKNGSYIYWNTEGRWWIDGPTGAGLYVCRSAQPLPVPDPGPDSSVDTSAASCWEPLTREAAQGLPVVTVTTRGRTAEL